MPSYSVTVQNNTYTVETETRDARASVRLDGVTHQLDWRQVAPLAGTDGRREAGGRYSLLSAGRSYEVFARPLPQTTDTSGRTYELFVGGQRFELQVEDTRTKQLASLTRGAAGSSAVRVQAPMPGLVVNVPVKPGMTVSQGQPVVVLEAMKMENDLPAPSAGTVKEVKVVRGQTVNQGDTLVVIEGDHPL